MSKKSRISINIIFFSFRVRSTFVFLLLKQNLSHWDNNLSAFSSAEEKKTFAQNSILSFHQFCFLFQFFMLSEKFINHLSLWIKGKNSFCAVLIQHLWTKSLKKMQKFSMFFKKSLHKIPFYFSLTNHRQWYAWKL